MTERGDGCIQLTESGRLRHLLKLSGLSRDFILNLLDQATAYQTETGELPARDQALEGRTVVNLFF